MNINKLITVGIMALVTVHAWADTWKDPATGYEWTYRINGGTAEIYNNYSAAISPTPTGSLTIPAMLGGKTVTSIGSYAFFQCSGLTSVTIPNSVTTIWSFVFSGCSGLTSVTIPASVTSIGSGAFKYCSGLTSVTIPESVCANRLSSVFPSSYQAITNVIISEGATSIGNDAFSGCSGLTSVTIPDSVTSIGSGAFKYCSGLTRVTIPGSVTSIGDYAFSGCTRLASVTIGNGVKKIESFAFEDCNIKSINIPDSVTNIETWAFDGCRQLAAVHISNLAKWCGTSFDNPGYYAPFPNPYKLYLNGTLVTDLVIPDCVTHINRWAFSGCNSLLSVTIPDSVTDIGYRAFYGCSSLANITMPGWFDGKLSEDVWGGCSNGLEIEYNPCVLSFDDNGGSVNEQTRIVEKGNVIGALPTPTRTGYYTFAGWWTAASGGTQISASTTVSGNVTYYAHWTVNQYTVTFNANGGAGGTTKTQEYGTSLTAPTVTRTGYTFTGWSPAVPSTVPAGNVTYTAQWQINQYTATFNANGGTGGTTKKQEYGTSLSAPTVTRTGYTFTGWSPAVPSTMPAGNTTYTAQWQINQYTATFNSNGGTGGTTKTQNYGTSLTAPTVTRTGYTFTGWSPSVPSTMPAGNTTYTAQWKVNQYTVTFNANGGMGGKSGKQNYGTAIVAPTVTREWCTFTGWSPAVAATVPANNVTYTAQWQRYGDTISASKMGGKTMRELYPSDYTHMTTVVIEEGVLELPAGFFDGCDKVESVTWPSTLVDFGIDAMPPKFLQSLSYNANGFMIYGNWILDYLDRNAAAVTIPEGIVGIGRGAFKEMFDLETVTMPESLRCIASGAFEDCSWIQNLQFMSGLRYVGPEAFRGCSSLLGASFADGVEYIGANAFAVAGRCSPCVCRTRWRTSATMRSRGAAQSAA